MLAYVETRNFPIIHDNQKRINNDVYQYGKVYSADKYPA
jgi:hypothetical protein